MFEHLVVGDKVVRMLAGSIPMELTVTEVKDDIVVCGYWEFDRKTGAEVDVDLNWGPLPLMTGSYLSPDNKIHVPELYKEG